MDVTSASNPPNNFPGLDIINQPKPLAYQQINSLNSVTGLTVPAGARTAMIRVSGQAVRFRDDGTNPTPTVGVPLEDGDMLTYEGNLTAIRFIEQTSAAALDIAYYA